MDPLFSFPVGLFHPLQHAGLSRRTPDCPSSGRNLYPDSSKPSHELFVRYTVNRRTINGARGTFGTKTEFILAA
jgi:hypothetical protein